MKNLSKNKLKDIYVSQKILLKQLFSFRESKKMEIFYLIFRFRVFKKKEYNILVLSILSKEKEK